MAKTAISTNDAPQAIGPYSQAIEHAGIIYLSGQIPLDPKTMQMVGTTAAEQAEQVMKNLQGLLRAAGVGFEHVVRTTIFLTDLADFTTVNEIYARFLVAPFPARATVQVAALPRGAKLEIDMIAAR